MSTSKSKSNPHEDKEEQFDTPLISNAVYANLPRLLSEGCECFEPNSRERDMFLTASLVLMGSALPNCYSYYDQKKVFFNLFAMIVAPPASGKGVITHASYYIRKIEKLYHDKYQSDLIEYEKSLKEKKTAEDDASKPTPKIRPKRKRIVIPANSSSAAFMTALFNSGGRGALYETEADTLAQVLKQDWGNYSDILRKAFHHEPVSFSRKGDDLDILIDQPQLSVLISGTPNQVGSMGLDNPANGLQSRFFFYLFENIPRFKDLSANTGKELEETFEKLSAEVFSVYTLLSNTNIEFILSAEQWKFVSHWFDKKLKSVTRRYNGYIAGLINRAALSAVRIAGIISILSECDGKLPGNKIQSSWQNLRTALLLADSYIQHGLVIFHFSKMAAKDEVMHKYMDFYDLLPADKEFTRRDVIELATQLGFAERTLDRRLEKLRKNGLLRSTRFGVYIKK